MMLHQGVALNCEDTFNEDNLREEVETYLFNTSLLSERAVVVFIHVCLGFATFLTLIKNAAFAEVLASLFIKEVICGS